MVVPLSTTVLAATVAALCPIPVEAFLGMGRLAMLSSPTSVTKPSTSSTETRQAETFMSMKIVNDPTAVGATNTANVPRRSSRGASETTLVRGRKVVHIATSHHCGGEMGAARTICDVISIEAGVSLDRADELVRFGAVYIGEDVRPHASSGGDSQGSRRGGRGDRENRQGGIAGMTDNQHRKMEAKRASGQLPFEGTSFDHMHLRRLRHREGSNPPPAGSYLRVHCDPRLFPVTDRTTWIDQVVVLTDDYIVVNKPAGMPTVPTIDNVIQSVLHQAGLVVARVSGYSDGDADNLPPMHAVSRLDVCTSGLVVFARNKLAAGKLNNMFSARQVTKHYLALLIPGPPIRTGSLAHCCRGKGFDGMRRAKIYADFDPELLEGKKWGGHWQEAHSTVITCVPAAGPTVTAAVAADRAAQRLQSSDTLTSLGAGKEQQQDGGHPAHLCLLKLDTGRNHQLRMQLAAMGAGIVGDTQYRGIVGRLHRGVPEDDRTDIFGQEPATIALTAARLEFEWNSERVVYTVKPPTWAILEKPSAEESTGGSLVDVEGEDNVEAVGTAVDAVR